MDCLKHLETHPPLQSLLITVDKRVCIAAKEFSHHPALVRT